MLKVSGRNRATAMEADRPGMEPKMIPTATPAAISSREVGVQIETNAPMRLVKASMRLIPPYRLMVKMPWGRTILKP